jgi:hypothetical protein
VMHILSLYFISKFRFFNEIHKAHFEQRELI